MKNYSLTEQQAAATKGDVLQYSYYTGKVVPFKRSAYVKSNFHKQFSWQFFQAL